MSNHPANDQLSAFLDGELNETEAASFEAALESDADLRAELEKLRNVQRLLRTHGPARAPEGFAARVIAAAETEGDNVVAGPWWRRPFGIPVEGVLIAAAAALVLIVALPKGTEPTPEMAPGAAVEKSEGKLKGTDAEVNGDDAVADAQGGEAEERGLGGLGTKGQGSGGGGAVAADAGSKSKPSPKGAPKPAPVTKGGLDANADEGVADIDGGAMDNAAVIDGAPPVQKGTDVEDPVMASAGMQAQLYTENEEILGTLQATISRYGGVIRDSKGTIVKTGLLTDSETLLFLDVPSDRIAELNKELAALGATVETTKGSTITAGSSMKMPIRVVLMGNGPSTGKQVPNAAKQKMSEDAYEAADEMIDQ